MSNYSQIFSGPLFLLLVASSISSCDGDKSRNNNGTISRDSNSKRQIQYSPERGASGNVVPRSSEDLENAWIQIQKRGLSENDRLLQERAIIEQLTIQGKFEDAKRFALSYGEGMNRSTMIYALFSKNPSSLNDLMRLAKDPSFPQKEKCWIYNGIARNIGQEGGMSKVSEFLAQGHKLSNTEAEAVAKGLGTYVNMDEAGLTYCPDPGFNRSGMSEADMESRYMAVESLLQNLGQTLPEIKTKILDSFIGTAIRTMPFECWQTLVDNYSSIDTKIRMFRASGLIEAMFFKSPQRALTSLEQIRQNDGAPALYGAGFNAWLIGDVTAAQNWYAANKASLSSAERDQIAAASAGHLGDSDQIENAWKWVDQIQDPILKKKSEGLVWQAEQNKIRKEVNGDPTQLINSIVSGQSKYADYWLEEAMGTWVAKDFNGAQDWYQKNWNSMPASKSQYLAAAFANQAINQGDAETARQWAALIQDAKTRDRINAGIAKAEKQK